MSPEEDRAPSAVCAIDTPSLALRVACVMPRIWEFMRSEIARPAASSFALLMRRPDDRRCREVDRALCEPDRLRCEFREAMLVLMTDAMVTLQTVLLFGHFARQLWPATLFRDAQAAVVTGNGFRMEIFR
ncbi:hypothetical protein GCM10007386_31690 [Pseudoduganella dura]|nr:hypothetical protein GCM10007386_31690 [Pseudoduganella dura]